VLKRLRERIARLRNNQAERREARDEHLKLEEIKRRGREAAQRERQRLLGLLDEELEKPEDERDADRIVHLKLGIKDYHRRAQERDAAHDHAHNRVGELTSKIKWGVKRRTTLRAKIKRAKAERSPQWQDWMANGHEGYNLTDRAKKLGAIAVVAYDLVITSITRSWGTGSHHESVPTRGFDCAGARMTEFQQDLRYGRIEGFELGDLLELFGPDNAACADNGAPYSMAEGSGIEQLHDNHTHAFVYGA
jgi:hypothetical protein